MKITPHTPVRTAAAPPAPAPPPPDRFELSPLREAFEAIPTPSATTGIRNLDANVEAWNARWKLLESAQDTIHAQYYTWDHDVFGKAQLGHVFLRARQGADVKIMVDAVGDTFGTRGFKSHIGGQDYLQEVAALPNVEAKVYHPHYKKLANAVLHPLGMEAIAANHDKFLEVDGRAGVTGGRNTGACYFVHEADDPEAWRDADVQLEGRQAAGELRQAFYAEWDQLLIHHKVRPDLLGNWRKRDVELLGAYALMDAWLKGEPLSQESKAALRTSEDERKRTASEMVAAALQELPQLGLTRKPEKRELAALQQMAQDLARYPELRGSYAQPLPASQAAEVKVIDKTSALADLDEINGSLLGLVNGAQKSIVIQTPYYVLTDKVIDALQAADARGVDIKIATNSPSNTDSYFTQAFFLNDWEKSMATIPGMELYAATGQRKAHGKRAVIDGEVAVVGTYNLDLVSARVNGEIGAVVWSRDFASEVIEAIEADFPRVGYTEYQIARDANGNGVDAEGRPVLLDGELVGKPAALFGPENHVDPAELKSYEKRIRRWNWAREHVPQLAPLRRFAGED